MILMINQLFDNSVFSLIILPILIFSFRVVDVALGTLRIVFISQGRKKLAPLVGFFEMLIWLFAMGQIFSNLTNIIYYIAYASGFAMGNYTGLILESKISLGLLSLHLIVRENHEELVKTLKAQGYGLTTLTAEGLKTSVKLVILVIKRKNLAKILDIIKNVTPNAFMSIENVKSVKGGNFPLPQKTRWELLHRRKK
ncbi:MAG: DUF2179 domain-containing protein [Candidatus Lokiarchaeota archaeon]|nr:DUF2179 domain-containing protein [Candidatus Lokiarchaeota archaeon]